MEDAIDTIDLGNDLCAAVVLLAIIRVPLDRIYGCLELATRKELHQTLLERHVVFVGQCLVCCHVEAIHVCLLQVELGKL